MCSSDLLAIVTRPASPLAPRTRWWHLEAPWLRRVGEVSFGMYVLHLPMHQMLGRWLMQIMGSPARVSLGFNLAYATGMSVLLYGLAWLSYRFWEQPFLRLKDRLAAYAPTRQPA